MNDVEFLIIGAGPTGIGAARRLIERGRTDFLVLEKEATPGGLAGSETDANGFTWDYGGHVQFSHYKTFDVAMQAALGDDGWYTHQRESWVWLKNRFIPYPFQNNLHRLDPADCAACLAGLKGAAERARRGSNSPINNFGEWALRTFGGGICDLFFRPYNFKVWAYPLEALDFKWVGERVAVPDLQQLAKLERNIASKTDDVSWGPNRTFRFPKQGGTGAIWRSLAQQLPKASVKTNASVQQVDARGRSVTLVSGETIRYRHLISTLPVDLLAALTANAEHIAAAQGLVHSSTNLFGIGITGKPPESIATKCWMYFPEANCPFYRATVFSRYSPANVPDASKQWSLLLEISESSAKPVDAQALRQQVIDGLVATHLIAEPKDICDVWQRRLPYGYPTPSRGRDAALAKLLPAFEAENIFSRGRFGAWKYEVSNQDHSYMQGVELVDRLLGVVDPNDGPEPTLNRPALVNAGGRP